MAANLSPTLVAAFVLASSTFSVAGETIRVSDTAALQEAIESARPGTVILLASRSYLGDLFLSGIRGRAGEPIVIAAADPKKPPTIHGGEICLHLAGAEYVELRDLNFRFGQFGGLNIDDGGDFARPARGIVLRRLRVVKCGGLDNNDGIKLSGLDNFRIEDCTVEEWGHGGSGIDLVGCHRGLITGCSIKYRPNRGLTGIQVKGGSREIVVRRCRFEHAGQRSVNIGGNTSLPYFRPRPEGFEARDITVEDCTFIGSLSPINFVGIDGAVARHNTIYRPKRWVFRILQETRESGFVPSRRGRFERNLIVYRSDELNTGVNVGDATEPNSFRSASNYWYCQDDPDAGVPRIAIPHRDESTGDAPKFADAEAGDFTVPSDSPAAAFGARSE